MRLRTFGMDATKVIIPSPISQAKRTGKRKYAYAFSYMEARLSTEGAAFDDSSWRDTLNFEHVYCKEHRRMELVPSGNYNGDLDTWYQYGLHPRFSILKTLLEGGKQQLTEARWSIFRRNNNENSKREKAHNRLRKAILKKSRTPKQLLKNAHELLFTNLYVNGRRLRVTNEFKRKFNDHTFTNEDFLHENNQELRRYMLRRGVSIQSVLGQMKLIKQDDEGRIYQMGEDNNWRSSRYLYVTCPSTGQEYLLNVPNGRRGEDMTPAQARRWTFNLPEDATFAKEA